MKIIDTHCHLDIPAFEKELESIIEQATNLGVSDFILPGYIESGWTNLLEKCRKHEVLHAAPGLHPIYITNHSSEHVERLAAICQKEHIVAIGEIGLDFLHDNNEQSQRDLFESQLHIAKKHDLPVLIHVRKAHDQVASILRKNNFEPGGIVHAFNGSLQQAKRFIELGFKLGYGGNITYTRAKRIRHLAKTLPLSAIVLETDAPDIPLSHRREQINSPLFLPEILQELSRIRPEPIEEIAHQTSMNTQSVIPGIQKRKQ